MFLNLFYTLRTLKVPVSITEWMTLMQALDQGYAQGSLTDFYQSGPGHPHQVRGLLRPVRPGILPRFQATPSLPPDIRQEILDWLADPLNRLELDQEELAKIKPDGLGRTAPGV